MQSSARLNSFFETSSARATRSADTRALPVKDGLCLIPDTDEMEEGRGGATDWAYVLAGKTRTH